MDIRIVAVGRLRKSAELDLITEYLDRAVKQGRGFGFSSFDVHEIDDRKSQDKSVQAEQLRAALGNEVFWALDERGRVMSSPEFAQGLATHRDDAAGRLNLVIGGADGLDPELVVQARQTISFGKMVWPHMLARVMLSEQCYRAMTILAGGPYHRG